MKRLFSTSLFNKIFLLLLATILTLQPVIAQQKVKKVVFQAFWWDYWNDNFRFSWANYLTELAPRLKAAGFNAIWIPPAIKNANPDYVGYMPFDNYDLGDKRQKGNGHPLNDRLRTRVGTKDDLLRMVAVMHANGIEVIEDIVLNHNGDAGGGVYIYGGSGSSGIAGAGGYDPSSGSTGTAGGYKNFRYVSYSTPAIDETQNDYWTRNGRWPKNFTNFYNCSSFCDDITTTYWGPDISYDAAAIGTSSNIPTTGSATINSITRNYYNPSQANNYMQNNARDWLVWMKKQAGFDGWRFDAVKHYSRTVQETAIWHTKYNSTLTAQQAGGQEMFSVGEWIGDQFILDAYADYVKSPTAPGGVTNEKHTGTLDFALRGYNTSGIGGLYKMVTSGSSFNMQSLPGEQQGFRYFDYPSGLRVHRSVNFVNSHDNFRPIVSANGNYSQALGVNSGWNTGSELGGNGQHIDPREPRLFSAYATCFAMDGNPMVYFEDLFDIGTTGKRWSHLPTNTTDLPIRGDIVNLMQAHQKLSFKDGDYGVPTGSNSPFYQTGSAGDHLVIERVGKAIIGITDAYSTVNNNTADQQVYCKVNDAWAVGTVLYDYSGAHGISTVTIPSDRRVLIQTAPTGHTIANAYGHGYSIWAPAPTGVTISSVTDLYNYLATYAPTRSTETQQEWEMADDLGDSHCESLGQGGALPANSTNQRVAGKIYVQAGTNISLKITGETAGSIINYQLLNLDGNGSSGGAATPYTANFTATSTGWLTIKVSQGNNAQAKQKAWVNVTYTAPAVVDTRATANAVSTKAAIWTGNKGTTDITDCGNWEEAILPSSTKKLIISGRSNPQPIITSDLTVASVVLADNANVQIASGATLTVNSYLSTNAQSGENTISGLGTILFPTGASGISGDAPLSINNLKINSTTDVPISANVTINNSLTFVTGKFTLTNNNITIGNAASVSGASTSSYIKTSNVSTETGSVVQNVSSSSVTFPVGNTNYTPITLSNTGTATNFSVRCFENVLQDGTTGTQLSITGRLNKSWVITPATNTGLNVNATFSWNTADEGAGFNRGISTVVKNENNGSLTWYKASATAAATGSNPYSYSASGLTSFSTFSVFSDLSTVPVEFLSFNIEAKGKNALLKWSTGNEINNKGFYVEKSLNGIDFKAIDFVSAANDNATYHQYQYTDIVKARKAYYRLQQVDKDGKVSYSKIVEFALNTQVQLVQVAPNPVKDNIELFAGTDLNFNANITVRVYSSTGLMLKTITGNFEKVKTEIKTVLSNKAAGLYIFNIEANNEIQFIKVMKQ